MAFPPARDLSADGDIVCRTLCFAGLFAIHVAAGGAWAFDQASSIPADLGEDGFSSNGMAARLAPHWQPVADCRDLGADDGENPYRQMGVLDDGTPVDLACAMQDAGHRVSHVAHVTASYPAMGLPHPRLFYLITLQSGHQAILDGEISHSAPGPDGQLYLLGHYLRLWNAETGRAYMLPPHQRPPAGTTENPIVAHLLGRDGFDLERIGILPFGATPAPPDASDLAGALRRRLNDTYPAHGCDNGFRSSFQADSRIEVCVNYKDVEIAKCRPVQADGRAFRCDIDFRVVAQSGTHNGVNAMLRDQALLRRMTDYLFIHGPDGRWILEAPDDDIHWTVPGEFRSRKPFGG